MICTFWIIVKIHFNSQNYNINSTWKKYNLKVDFNQDLTRNFRKDLESNNTNCEWRTLDYCDKIFLTLVPSDQSYLCHEDFQTSRFSKLCAESLRIRLKYIQTVHNVCNQRKSNHNERMWEVLIHQCQIRNAVTSLIKFW